MKIDAIILAGGSSLRFENGNKLLYKINNKSVIEYTLYNFLNCDFIDNIILVYNEHYENEFKNIIDKNNYSNIIMTKGGNTRTLSVLNGLKSSNADSVFIHDGARVFIRDNLLYEMKTQLKNNSIVIPCIEPVETVRIYENDKITLLNRKNIRLIQTPQYTYRTYLMESITDALNKGMEFTDDAEYIAYNGGNIIMIKGDRYNIKITDKSDIELIEYILKKEHE